MTETDRSYAARAGRHPGVLAATTAGDRPDRFLAPPGPCAAAVCRGEVGRRRSGPRATMITGVMACALVFGTVVVAPASVAAQQCPPQQQCPTPPPPDNPPSDGGQQGGGQQGGGQQGGGQQGQEGGRHGQDGGRHGRDAGRPDLTDLAATGGAGGTGTAGPAEPVTTVTFTQQSLPVDRPAPGALPDTDPQEPLSALQSVPVSTNSTLITTLFVDPLPADPMTIPISPTVHTTTTFLPTTILPPVVPDATLITTLNVEPIPADLLTMPTTTTLTVVGPPQNVPLDAPRPEPTQPTLHTVTFPFVTPNVHPPSGIPAIGDFRGNVLLMVEVIRENLSALDAILKKP